MNILYVIKIFFSFFLSNLDGRGGGFQNDVWSSKVSSKTVESWRTTIDLDPPVYATQKWAQMNPGHHPPAAVTHDEWIVCQKYFNDRRDTSSSCDNCSNNYDISHCDKEGSFKNENMWSPRRGHAAVVSNNKIYVIGGRAREYVVDDDNRVVGESKINYKYSSIKDHSTLREHAILKNDIWMSPDSGKTWELVTPGCKDQQNDIISKTELWSKDKGSNKDAHIKGSLASQCLKSSDCYGDAECIFDGNKESGLCICSMFGVREHHTVSVQHRYYKTDENSTFTEDYMYLVGGFTNVRQSFCSEYSCGSRVTYRLAMDDAWVSNNSGVTWLQLKSASGNGSFRGRGYHSSLLIHSNPFSQISNSFDRLFILGGETSVVKLESHVHLNDMWAVNITTTPCCYFNGNCQAISHPLRIDDLGSCLPDASKWYEVSNNSSWSPRSGHTTIHEPPSSLNGFQDKIYIIGGMNHDGIKSDVWLWYPSRNLWIQDFESLHTLNTGNKRYINYYDEHSRLSDLFRFHLPLPNKLKNDQFNSVIPEHHLSSDHITRLRNLGINTFVDLANTDLRTILKLRGYDYPGLDVFEVPNICYVKILVHEFITKCTVKDETYPQEITCNPSDIECIVHNWDGCAPITNLTKIDVHGIGDVSVLNHIDDPFPDLEEMHCKQVPAKRHSSAGVFIDGKTFLMGGRGVNSTLFQDTWSRDDTFPLSSMLMKPLSHSTQSKFRFDSNEDGATQFEYKLFDKVERLPVTPWLRTTVNQVIDVSWLDTKKDGPGNGWYTLYLRAIDPSGNRDSAYMINQNVHTWYYIQPLPWGKISLGIVTIVCALTLSYFQYRRIQRKAALERFAKRRAKRKFKLNAMSGDGELDWKDYFHNQAIQKTSKKSRENSTYHRGLKKEVQISSNSRNDTKRRPGLTTQNDNDWKKRRRERRIEREKHLLNTEDGNSTEEENRPQRKSSSRSRTKKNRRRYDKNEHQRKKYR